MKKNLKKQSYNEWLYTLLRTEEETGGEGVYIQRIYELAAAKDKEEKHRVRSGISALYRRKMLKHVEYAMWATV